MKSVIFSNDHIVIQFFSYLGQVTHTKLLKIFYRFWNRLSK